MFEDQSIRRIIRDYLFKNLDLFKANVDKAQRVFDPEAIHDYRVAVKRIRSIVTALDNATESMVFPETMIFPLRLMFKAGGTIRDDQVQIGMVEDFEKQDNTAFPLIKEFYYQRIREQRDAFFVKSFDIDLSDLDDLREQIEESLEPLDDKVLETWMYNWLSESNAKLRRKRYDLEKPERLHKFRTRYKQNGYVVEMIFQAGFDQRISKKTFSKMKAFGQELGNWHDYFQLRSKTGFIFNESRNINLLEEAFNLRKLVTPVHDLLFQEILHHIKRDDTLFQI
jgi:CHAD domain-containing protein